MEQTSGIPFPDTEAARLCLVTSCPSIGEVLRRQRGAGRTVAVHAPGRLLQLPPQHHLHVVTHADVVLVDWRPETVPAFLALQPLAFTRGVPVFAVCRGPEADHVAALVMGADDALAWPLKPILLEARLMAYHRLRSARRPAAAGGDGGALPPPAPRTAHDPHDGLAVLGRLMLDRTARHFFVDGTLVVLTPIEFALMSLLMHRPGACLTRREIIEEIWDIDFATGTNMLDVRVYGLRRKLRPFGLHTAIATVRGTGYRLDG